MKFPTTILELAVFLEPFDALQTHNLNFKVLHPHCVFIYR